MTPPVITSQPLSRLVASGSTVALTVTAAGSGPLGYAWCLNGTNVIQSGPSPTLALISVSTNNTGNYSVVITNAYGAVTSSVAALTVLLGNIVPANQTVLPGYTAVFSVAGSGAGPFSYQWQFNGTNIPNNIITTVAGNGIAGHTGDGGAAQVGLYFPGGVALDALGNLYIADTSNHRIRKVWLNAGYPLIHVGTNNSGSYSVVITSPYGSVTSTVAMLTVQAPPVITVQPTNLTVPAGSSPIFSVAVAGSGPFGYFADTNLLQNDTNNTLALPCVFTNNAGNYTVVVTNAYGSVTSAVAALTVTIPRTAPQIVACDASFGFLTNQFGFNLSGDSGQTIVVDGSADLVNWTPLCTNTVGSSAVYFCDPGWTNFGWRFYRARLR